MNTFERNKCDFASGCTERMCRTLDRAGVPADNKWRTLILYMRSMEHFDYLTEKQQANIQALIVQTLRGKDYSDEKFNEILEQQEEIINAPCNQKLASALKETAELVSEFKKLLYARSGDVENLEGKTVNAVQSGQSPEDVISELKKAFREVVEVMQNDADNLNQMTRTDALTNIANRRGFDDSLDEAVAAWRKEGRPLSLIMCDIDKFKVFNDTYGHRIGDQALITVAKLLKQTQAEQQEQGFVLHPARYGGEEFAVILPGIDADKGLELADIIRRKVEDYNFIIRGADGKVLKRGIKITISLGVAAMEDNWTGAFTDNLIESADKALYDAKRGGRNLALKYDPESGLGVTGK